jgi:hypothetical protein
MTSSMLRVGLIVEFLLLFVALPLGYRFSPVRVPALPLLWLVAGYALWVLWSDARFDRSKLWNAAALPGKLGWILGIFIVVALAIWIGVWHYAPGLQWGLVRQRPLVWLLVMAAYPWFSVYPQSVLYRAFFFERYQPLFPGKWAMIWMSAAAFAFLHIVFRNGLAVELTFAGGLLFAERYAETGSLATSSFEHALYGCWIFTVGLGEYFYHGTVADLGATLSR